MMRAAAMSTGPDTHLDHLGVLSSLLSIPLIVDQEETFLLAQRFYPEVELLFKDPAELSLDYIASHYDVLFECGKFWTLELAPLLEWFTQKKMRFVFCPHGNSDKGASASSHVLQDICLIYGEQMLDLLISAQALSKIKSTITTGNYRLPYYERHREFYDGCIQSELFSRIEKRSKTILYAPTWQNKETLTSFFQACPQLIEELPSSYTLIIKLHPLLEEFYPAHTYQLLAKYENHPGVHFLTRFPPIYPLLAHTDIYLGDFSSIGYDFLAFNRPMYFFNPHTSSTFLHRCGLTLPHTNIYDFIEKTLEENQSRFSEVRQEVYNYAFGSQKDPALLKQEIFSHLS